MGEEYHRMTPPVNFGPKTHDRQYPKIRNAPVSLCTALQALFLGSVRYLPYPAPSGP